MSVTVIRTEKNQDNPFTMVDKKILENKKLSWAAKGLLSYLLSRPDNWKVYLKELNSRSTDGQSSTKSAVDELIKEGYLELKPRKNEGKFEGYDFKIIENPTKKPDTIIRNGKPVTDYPIRAIRNGKPNTNNTNINNTELSNIILSKDSINSPNSEKELGQNLLDPKKLEYNIPAPIFSIIKDLNELGQFNHRLPPPNQSPTKLIQQTIKYLKDIKSGMFTRNIKLDEKWSKKFIKQYPDIKGYETWREVKNLIMDSCNKMIIDLGNAKKSGGALWYPKTINQFFFNSPDKRTGTDPGKSMFLKYLNIEAKTVEQNRVEWQMKAIPESVQKIIKEYLAKNQLAYEGQEELLFWGNMRQLCTWYNKNTERLIKYNDAYNDNGWGYHCGDIGRFFNFVVQYLTEYRFRNAKPLPVEGNNYWDRFRAYLLNGFNIEIYIDSKKEGEIGKVIKKNEEVEHSRELEMEIEKIKLELDAQGITEPEYEELIEAAQTRINSG
jgi:hypothetical protein